MTERMVQARGVELRSLTEVIDTTTAGGRLIFHVFGAVAEFERAIAAERTAAGVAAARAAGRNIRVATMKAMAIPKAKVLGQTDGLLKAVVDADTGRILGVTLLCAEAHEVINLFKMAIDHNIPARYVKDQIFTHPTMAEALNDLFATLG